MTTLAEWCSWAWKCWSWQELFVSQHPLLFYCYRSNCALWSSEQDSLMMTSSTKHNIPNACHKRPWPWTNVLQAETNLKFQSFCCSYFLGQLDASFSGALSTFVLVRRHQRLKRQRKDLAKGSSTGSDSDIEMANTSKNRGIGLGDNMQPLMLPGSATGTPSNSLGSSGDSRRHSHKVRRFAWSLLHSHGE